MDDNKKSEQREKVEKLLLFVKDKRKEGQEARIKKMLAKNELDRKERKKRMNAYMKKIGFWE